MCNVGRRELSHCQNATQNILQAPRNWIWDICSHISKYSEDPTCSRSLGKSISLRSTPQLGKRLTDFNLTRTFTSIAPISSRKTLGMRKPHGRYHILLRYTCLGFVYFRGDLELCISLCSISPKGTYCFGHDFTNILIFYTSKKNFGISDEPPLTLQYSSFNVKWIDLQRVVVSTSAFFRYCAGPYLLTLFVLPGWNLYSL